jgi:hypothetical protein
MRLFEKLPMEVEEQILMYLSSDDIIILGEDNVSGYIWERMSHKTIGEAAKNNNLTRIKYLVEQCGADIHMNTPIQKLFGTLSISNSFYHQVTIKQFLIIIENYLTT